MPNKKPLQKSLFENVEDKIKYSTSSVEELRVPIYAPVKQLPPQSSAAIEFKKNNNVRTIQTKWGHVEIRNRLVTQTHKDIMDLISTYNKKIKRLDDGTIALYFSQSEISKISLKSRVSSSLDFIFFLILFVLFSNLYKSECK